MQIYTEIANVMAEIGAVSKTGTNGQQGYKYRGIDAVMNALHPAMVKHHIFVVPEVLEHTRKERQTSKGGLLIYSICKIRYKFYAEDGSSVESIVIGEGMDSGDKATNKAMSVAFKYACFQVFCIPTEEMIDPEVDSPEPLPKKAPKIPKISVAITDENAKSKISNEDLKKATKFITDEKIISYIYESYKIQDLSELTNIQYYSILNNWQRFVDEVSKCKEKPKN